MSSFAQSPCVLLVGDHGHADFAAPLAVLHAETKLVLAESLPAACRLLASGDLAPHLIVVLQTRPGEFSAAGLEPLRTLAPLAKLVGLMGSWCEGELRTGNPWPSESRWYWYEGPARLSRSLQQVHEAVCPEWGLPLTANPLERLLAVSRAEPSRQTGLLVVCTRHVETAAALGDALAWGGLACSWVRPGKAVPVRGATAGIWEGSQLDADATEELADFCRRMPDTPVVALLDFPRADALEIVRAAGGTAILAKPFLMEDLHWTIGQVVGGAFSQGEKQRSVTARETLDSSA